MPLAASTGMVRALWTGTITFGLVSIPVKLFRATTTGSAKSVSFHLLHKKCGTRIKNVRWCPRDDEAVEWKDLVKGFEVSKGQYVPVEPEELDEILPDEDFAAVSIDGFVKLAEVDPIELDRSYWAAPTGNPKAYSLLAKALEESQRVAIARVILRTRSHLAMVRAQSGHLVLTTMFYDDEIVDSGEIADLPQKPLANVDKRQLDTALQLIDAMTEKWDPSKYRDTYAEKVEELVEKKLSGGEVVAPPEVAAPREVVDLMAALKRSIKEAPQPRRSSRSSAGSLAERTRSRPKSRTRPPRSRASRR
jgi:DNA end-binding protein Ku